MIATTSPLQSGYTLWQWIGLFGLACALANPTATYEAFGQTSVCIPDPRFYNHAFPATVLHTVIPVKEGLKIATHDPHLLQSLENTFMLNPELIIRNCPRLTSESEILLTEAWRQNPEFFAKVMLDNPQMLSKTLEFHPNVLVNGVNMNPRAFIHVIQNDDVFAAQIVNHMELHHTDWARSTVTVTTDNTVTNTVIYTATPTARATPSPTGDLASEIGTIAGAGIIAVATLNGHVWFCHYMLDPAIVPHLHSACQVASLFVASETAGISASIFAQALSLGGHFPK